MNGDDGANGHFATSDASLFDEKRGDGLVNDLQYRCEQSAQSHGPAGKSAAVEKGIDLQ